MLSFSYEQQTLQRRCVCMLNILCMIWSWNQHAGSSNGSIAAPKLPSTLISWSHTFGSRDHPQTFGNTQHMMRENYYLKVFLKSAGHTSLSNISHCICFKKQFWEQPSSGAAEHSFTTGSANQAPSKLQQILPVPYCCSAPVKISSHSCSRNEQASIPSATPLITCPPRSSLHGAAEAPPAGLRQSANAWREPRLPTPWAHPASSP